MPANKNEAPYRTRPFQVLREEFRTGEGRRCVAKPALDVHRPEDHGNRKSEAQPELVTKHGDGVSDVTVVVSLGHWHFVTGMWVRRLSGDFMCHLVHLNSQTCRIATQVRNIDGRSRNRSEQQSDARGQRHGERTPERDAYCAHRYSCATRASG